MSYLIITGSFACGMAFHNTASRYFYSLGRERVLPSALGRAHHRWKSPWIATISMQVCSLSASGRLCASSGRTRSASTQSAA